MRNTTYLFTLFILFLLTHCKKASNDLLRPVVETGIYYPGERVIIGKIENLSSKIYMFGHVWDTFPSPTLERHAGMSNFFTEYDTIAYDSNVVITSSFDVNETMQVISHVENPVSDKLYYMIIYWKDEYSNREYGEEIMVHMCD